MTTNASGPGQAHRTGLSMMEITDLFPDDASAEAWFAGLRWPDGVECPKCGSTKIQTNAKHPSMPYRCGRDGCRKKFSVKLGTVMEGSNIGYRKWAFGIYLFCTSVKGISSMRLRRDLNLHQRSAWFMGHRIREAYRRDPERFSGPVEADESFAGGKEKNKHAKKKRRAGGGSAGKTIVAAVVDRQTNMVDAAVVPDASAQTLKAFVGDRTTSGARLYTDEATAYKGMPNHESVNHSAGEYVKDDAHTNSAESFFSLFDRGFVGVYHKMSPKHMDRYVQEFAGRKNDRHSDTIDQMANVARGMLGKRLKRHDLTAPTGESNHARPERPRG